MVHEKLEKAVIDYEACTKELREWSQNNPKLPNKIGK